MSATGYWHLISAPAQSWTESIEWDNSCNRPDLMAMAQPSNEMERQRVSSGAPWESTVGYSRAVRVGRHVFVSGTTATSQDGTTVAPGDAYAQTQLIFAKIETALRAVGASLADVVRTRMFVTDIQLWEQIGKAHAEIFGDIQPAATMVEVSRLINPDHLVEIEVDAVIEGP